MQLKKNDFENTIEVLLKGTEMALMGLNKEVQLMFKEVDVYRVVRAGI